MFASSDLLKPYVWIRCSARTPQAEESQTVSVTSRPPSGVSIWVSTTRPSESAELHQAEAVPRNEPRAAGPLGSLGAGPVSAGGLPAGLYP
jgi:hypothetical protein